MLDDLVEVINTLKARMADYRESLQDNETRTRTALIDPLLRALGWDVSDPALVTPEYNVGSRRPDYALLNDNAGPCALLEAKKLGEPLGNHQEQMVRDANMAGIPYAGLTDGNRWELYRVFEARPLAERRILSVIIADAPAHEVALQLLMLWRPNLQSGQPMQANEPILVSEEALLPVPQTPAPPLDPTPDSGWTPITGLPQDVSWRNHPSRVRFPNGDEEGVSGRKWKFVLVEVAEWLIRNYGLSQHQCPIGREPSKHIIHSEAVHPTSKPFFHPAQLSNGLFVAAHASAQNIADDCIALVQQFHQDPSQFQLRLSGP